MENDLIVVDDEIVDIQTPAAPNRPPGVPEAFVGQRLPKTVAEHALASSRPRRHQLASSSTDQSERTTRSTVAAVKPSKAAPKLKLKLSEKAAGLAPGTSFLGPYDRELDSDDEDLAFEEQFILRMPAGEDCEKLRKMVAAREVSNDVWFKFKDSRRAIFHIGNNAYFSKLVDLPCIIESQKTLDNKQMFKVADICQMLVVDNKVDDDESIGNQKNFNIEEFIWPHGITPPLHHVRKRRFRKRMNRRTIESVEQEVERLMDEDDLAAESKYELLDNVNPDWSDSEFVEKEEPLDAMTPAVGSEAGDVLATFSDGDDAEGGDEEEDNEPDGDIDEDLAAELDQALFDEGGDEEEEDESDDDDDDDEEEEEETLQARSLLNEEIQDLEAAVAKKRTEIASSANPLIKKRFEDALMKLTADLEMKLSQRDEMKEMRRIRREAGTEPEGDTDGDGGNANGTDGNGGNDVNDVEMDEDSDLFGDDTIS